MVPNEKECGRPMLHSFSFGTMLSRGAAAAGRHAVRRTGPTRLPPTSPNVPSQHRTFSASIRSAAAAATATQKAAGAGVVALVTAGSVGAVAFNLAGGPVALTEGKAASSEVQQPTDFLDDIKSTLAGLFGGTSGGKTPKDGDDESTNASDAKASSDEKEEESCQSGPGKKVRIPLDPETVAELPLMDLDYVRKHNGLTKTADGKLLVTYDGIVYDVTEFANHHPGGRDLLLTAAGLDLDHFFGNYAVHGQTEKAAQWLAPLAVGRLSEADAIRARELSTADAHVEKRMTILGKARQKIIVVAATLPVWMTLRSIVRFVGWVVPPLGKILAWAMPVSVPGLTPGAEPLQIEDKYGNKKEYTVAVIGGGIAGCGAAWALARDGFKVTLFEARKQISGNARTFEWDFSPYRSDPSVDGDQIVKSCVSVTAWPPLFYKNYTCLLDTLGVETVHQPLSWFLNSKVKGYEGTLWAADPRVYDGSLRKVFEKDFRLYNAVVTFARRTTDFFTLKWAPWRWNDTTSMYDTHQGLGLLNPLTVVPLYSIFKAIGGSDKWWDVIFTPHYTASFLVDELRPFPAVFGPLIEAQIPLIPNTGNTWQGPSKRGDADCNITTCVTWKDAGKGIREVFDKLVDGVTLKEDTRIREVEVLPNGKKRIHDEYDNYVDVDRVVFACPANAVGNIYKKHGKLEDVILSTPVYADDHHPSSGHMHAVMHSDGSVIDEKYRDTCLKRASNYVEITENKDGSINIENQYNFGVQTPGPGIYDLPLNKKPVMLISHALGEGKSIDPTLVRGTGNHARAHPLYSGWNVAAQLSLRLVQGKNGIYYCSNWTTPGNCHDMSLLSGLVCAHAIGAKYPFESNKEAKKDFNRLRDLMGV